SGLDGRLRRDQFHPAKIEHCPASDSFFGAFEQIDTVSKPDAVVIDPVGVWRCGSGCPHGVLGECQAGLFPEKLSNRLFRRWGQEEHLLNVTKLTALLSDSLSVSRQTFEHAGADIPAPMRAQRSRG